MLLLVRCREFYLYPCSLVNCTSSSSAFKSVVQIGCGISVMIVDRLSFALAESKRLAFYAFLPSSPAKTNHGSRLRISEKSRG